jgi:GNAT superfamily N-acetyltransferase
LALMDHPQESLTIRRIRPTDGGLLRDLRLRSLEDSPEAFGQTVAEARATRAAEWHRRALQSCRGDHRAWLFAERGSRPVGLVHGRRRSPATLLLFSMWVEPASRRGGVGRQLIDGLEAWASGWGGHETILWVFRSNARAMAFYASLGFGVVPDGPDVEAGAEYEAIALSRPMERQI